MKDVQELNQVSKHSYFASMVETRLFFYSNNAMFFPLGENFGKKCSLSDSVEQG